ncbi:putative stomatin/prohibitin-family membrane protease subunit YbbK [Pseudonocardia sp. Ae168_Ps1]|uniref:SPFH domain-containing protein n=1 Tax=unclassified Pseudonocardia TaxID=2619320 RepID=UPI00094AA04E|nr:MULTISPECIES: SPFH domain-containing protein [unclassified Pseudonocardia]OLL72182.1 putative stomatin/prohibitin-family membrane protease subunit YbbK [Pseudonocardia sp. Ae150A_Ps1]OLL78150.1 putative stomatin/prohibitin-family membrane protease subunit YbbK [Pseudonocardia sp. Ae168_Ps1]OLL87727.1 putative stomatin/prohibitin-family membrane protease subunit YbbK [Pseudonocardia sp. Ae263_Ps1]OLL92246.1 putative stomatin/prohibitin-family membrane protease subunit YbbK [Pseudonocardia sp.
MDAGVIIAIVLLVLVVTIVVKSIVIVPQEWAYIIERLGRYHSTREGGPAILVPFVDRTRERVDLREQVVSFPPQPVITQDNLTVNIDTVVYFKVNDAKAAVYEIANYIAGVEQITTTTLRNVVGGMTLEQTLTSRDRINTALRGELDEATERWGIRVARVEIKAIDPPPSIQNSMEQQMKADREKRAMILTAEGQRESAIRSAEGQKQSQILTAEGAKQASILEAEAERQGEILRAQGRRAAQYLEAQGAAKAIEKKFAAIKAGRPTPELLAYEYLQTLPEMAQGEASKMWVVPSDFGKALEGFTRMLGAPGDDGVFRYTPSPDDGTVSRPAADDDSVEDWFDTSTDPEIARQVAEATAAAQAEVPPVGDRPASGGDGGGSSPSQIEASRQVPGLSTTPGDVQPHPNGEHQG